MCDDDGGYPKTSGTLVTTEHSNGKSANLNLTHISKYYGLNMGF